MLRKMLLCIIMIILFFNIVFGEDNAKTVKAELLDIQTVSQVSFDMRIVRLKILEGQFNG